MNRKTSSLLACFLSSILLLQIVSFSPVEAHLDEPEPSDAPKILVKAELTKFKMSAGAFLDNYDGANSKVEIKLTPIVTHEEGHTLNEKMDPIEFDIAFAVNQRPPHGFDSNCVTSAGVGGRYVSRTEECFQKLLDFTGQEISVDLSEKFYDHIECWPRGTVEVTWEIDEVDDGIGGTLAWGVAGSLGALLGLVVSGGSAGTLTGVGVVLGTGVASATAAALAPVNDKLGQKGERAPEPSHQNFPISTPVGITKNGNTVEWKVTVEKIADRCVERPVTHPQSGDPKVGQTFKNQTEFAIKYEKTVNDLFEGADMIFKEIENNPVEQGLNYTDEQIQEIKIHSKRHLVESIDYVLTTAIVLGEKLPDRSMYLDMRDQARILSSDGSYEKSLEVYENIFRDLKQPLIELIPEVDKLSILSPFHQFKRGTPIDEVVCEEGFSKVILHKTLPGCVTPTSVEKLSERGYPIKLIQEKMLE